MADTRTIFHLENGESKMTRTLVAVQELPPKGGVGRLELTWRSSRHCFTEVRTMTAVNKLPGVEDFTTTEIITYQDKAERDRLLRIYRPDAIAK